MNVKKITLTCISSALLGLFSLAAHAGPFVVTADIVTESGEGSTYTGSWADGQRSGSGTVNYANGDQFSGSFAADLRDGSGTYTWANGTTYRGTWKAGEARKTRRLRARAVIAR